MIPKSGVSALIHCRGLLVDAAPLPRRGTLMQSTVAAERGLHHAPPQGGRVPANAPLRSEVLSGPVVTWIDPACAVASSP